MPPAQNVPKYGGHTVMLIDERTISQAEHTGLFFEAANGTTFIGSPTNGANGDLTTLALPGSITMSFSGLDVRHADGRRLQRVGLQPQVAVTPTIAGIRAARDEVLETASRYVGGTGEIPADTLRETAAVELAAKEDELVNGWTPAASATGEYRIGIDPSLAHGGSSSGHISARTSMPNGFATLMQVVRGDSFRGKRVRFSAFVKSRDIADGGLWMRVDGNAPSWPSTTSNRSELLCVESPIVERACGASNRAIREPTELQARTAVKSLRQDEMFHFPNCAFSAVLRPSERASGVASHGSSAARSASVSRPRRLPTD
ncbi:MAG: S41 family peptidase [Gemmatimonadaceae bacterium]